MSSELIDTMSTGKQRTIYITTTLPYVNAEPHVGFAMEIIRADALARYYRAQGYAVFLNTGTDEHGAKIYEAAQRQGIDPKTYTDHYAAKFRELISTLHLAVDNFIRTTDAHHVAAAQEFWKRCADAGDIYKKQYRMKYCVGCELEKTDSELVHGRCPIHPNRELEIREEENYFFRFSRYTKPLLAYYAAHPDLVIPDFRFNETKAFVERGLEDFSISRLRAKMPWGVPVPGDDTQVMYVWFDALVNYISAIGWPDNMTQFERWWPVIQYCGKDNNRQQSAMWQAMLMSAGITERYGGSQHIIIDGFITSGGQKMSKSLGNVINPFTIIDFFRSSTPFPEDVLRFVLLHDIPSFEDGDLTMESIEASYVANLQNGIGNLTNRIMKMAQEHLPAPIRNEGVDRIILDQFYSAFEMQGAMHRIWEHIRNLDVLIQQEKPFQVVKTDQKKGIEIVAMLVQKLFQIAKALEPLLPRTAHEIQRVIAENRMPEKPLFGRIT